MVIASTEQLARRLQGRLITPDADDYDRARAIWNRRIDRYPAMIAQCVSLQDVITCVNYAREHCLTVAVRAGGHSLTGRNVCDGGIVIDLSALNTIQIDPQQQRVRVDGGATWGELDCVTQQHGLAVPGGIVSDTGIVGLALGGGLGWLRNPYGLTCDHLLSSEMVTAQGRLVKASTHENTDLYWGLRGGGGGYGVVTRCEFQLSPVGPDVTFGYVVYPGAVARDALAFYRDYVATVPDSVTSMVMMGRVPAHAMFPEVAYGEPYILFAACHVGPTAEGRHLIAPLRTFATPLVDHSTVLPYVEMQTVWDTEETGQRYAWESLFFDELSDAALDKLSSVAYEGSASQTTLALWHMGGAIRQIEPTATAFYHRRSAFMLSIEASWRQATDDNTMQNQVRRVLNLVQPFSSGGQYLNFTSVLHAAPRQALFGPNSERLIALKQRYDPTNVFM